MRRSLLILATLLALLTAATIFAVVTVENVLAHENDALHSVICFSENFVKHDKKLTPEQKLQDLRIYDRMLRVAYLPPCN